MPCIASDFKRELRPSFRFPHPSETLVTGDAAVGGRTAVEDLSLIHI